MAKELARGRHGQKLKNSRWWYGEEEARRRGGGAGRGARLGRVFSEEVEVSGAARSQGRDRGGVGGAVGVLEVGGAGKKKRNPAPLFIAPRW